MDGQDCDKTHNGDPIICAKNAVCWLRRNKSCKYLDATENKSCKSGDAAKMCMRW